MFALYIFSEHRAAALWQYMKKAYVQIFLHNMHKLLLTVYYLNALNRNLSSLLLEIMKCICIKGCFESNTDVWILLFFSSSSSPILYDAHYSLGAIWSKSAPCQKWRLPAPVKCSIPCVPDVLQQHRDMQTETVPPASRMHLEPWKRQWWDRTLSRGLISSV